MHQIILTQFAIQEQSKSAGFMVSFGTKLESFLLAYGRNTPIS